MIEPIQIELDNVQYESGRVTEVIKIASGTFKGRACGQWIYEDGEYSVADNMGANAFTTSNIDEAMHWALGLAYRDVARRMRNLRD